MTTHEGPVTEHGLLQIKPGQGAEFEAAIAAALPLIAGSPGFGSIRVSRCLERSDTYLLIVEWDSLAAHTEGFRGSPAYQQWRAALHHFYEPTPTIEHFTTAVAG